MSWLSNLLDLLFRRRPPVPPDVPPDDPPDADGDVSDGVGVRLLAMHNRERASRRVPPLRMSVALSRAALTEAQLVCKTGQFSHTPGGSQLTTRVDAAGYGAWSQLGENLAGDFPTPEDAMSAWMGSPGHRTNILGTYAEVGFALLKCKSKNIWVATFATRSLGMSPRAFASPQLAGMVHPDEAHDYTNM